MQDAVAKEGWRQKAKLLKGEVFALYYAYKDPRVPWYAKIFIIIVVGYAFSPIDLIPDFIPILGYLDDFILIPLGVSIALKMIPAPVMEDARRKAAETKVKIKNWVAAVIIIALWLALILWLLWRSPLFQQKLVT